MPNCGQVEIPRTSGSSSAPASGVHIARNASSPSPRTSQSMNAARAALAHAGVRCAVDRSDRAWRPRLPINTFPALPPSRYRMLSLHHEGVPLSTSQARMLGIYFSQLATADNFFAHGRGVHGRALVIGADTFSRSWTGTTGGINLRCCFGDGAGANRASPPGLDSASKPDRGVLTRIWRSTARHKSKLLSDGGVSSSLLDRPSVYLHECREVVPGTPSAVITDVDRRRIQGLRHHARRHRTKLIRPHQANKRIIDALVAPAAYFRRRKW